MLICSRTCCFRANSGKGAHAGSLVNWEGCLLQTQRAEFLLKQAMHLLNRFWRGCREVFVFQRIVFQIVKLVGTVQSLNQTPLGGSHHRGHLDQAGSEILPRPSTIFVLRPFWISSR